MSLQVDQILAERKAEIQQWLQEKREEIYNLRLPIYSSFDLRDGGYKTAVIDSNVFPAGFNNLDMNAQKRAIEAFSSYIPTLFSGKDILIIPETHTRNLYYLRNLKVIQTILKKTGYNATIGTLREDICDDCTEAEDCDGEKLILEKMFKNGNKLQTTSFSDGLILLNNDFSVPYPPLLDDLEQIILPPLKLSWIYRKKSTHYQYLNCFLEQFAKKFDIDPWFFTTIYEYINNINFKDPETLPKVSKVVDEILEKIQAKYNQYGIKDTPYVFVKDNSGTYGMGIISVYSGDEIIQLNRAKRNKMAFGKQRSPITSVIIQEGIRTTQKVNGAPAEPVIYNVGGKIVGGFTRFHPKRDKSENLNTPGMQFGELFTDRATMPIIQGTKEISLYTLLVDVATIAIAYEYGRIDPC